MSSPAITPETRIYYNGIIVRRVAAISETRIDPTQPMTEQIAPSEAEYTLPHVRRQNNRNGTDRATGDRSALV